MKEGISAESFVHIVPTSDAKAETITNSIVTTLDTKGIDMTRVVWIAFDGTSNHVCMVVSQVFKLTFERKSVLMHTMFTVEAIFYSMLARKSSPLKICFQHSTVCTDFSL